MTFSASNNCTILSRGKGIVKTGLVIVLPVGVYAQIAPCSRLAIHIFIDVDAGVIDSDDQGKIKAILFNHFAKDFDVKVSDQIAQLILERIETPELKKVAVIDDTGRGARGFGSIGKQSKLLSLQINHKQGKKNPPSSRPGS